MTLSTSLPSRTSDATYTVTVDTETLATTCTCAAGAHGKRCWHAAAMRSTALDRAASLQTQFLAAQADQRAQRAAAFQARMARQ